MSQSISSSKYLSFSSSSGFLFTSSLHINLISLSFKFRIFWQLPSCFWYSSYFLSFRGRFECWLSCIRLNVHYEKHWQCLLDQINKKHRLERRIYGLSKIGEITVENSRYILLSKSLQKVLSSIIFWKLRSKW